MSTGAVTLWAVSALLWLAFIAWIIAGGIEDTRAGNFMERLWLRIARPIDRALQRITATRKK